VSLDHLMAPDWAEAMAPVEPQITAMGESLRAELAAGRAYLPEPDAIFRAFRTPLAQVRVLITGQDPYPTPGHAMGLSFSVRAACATSTPSSRPTSGSRQRPTATSRRGRTAASCCSTAR
jgi:uracil DNA glycosylase